MYFRWTLLYGLKLVVKSNYERKVHKIAFIFHWVNLRKNFRGLHKNTRVTKKLPVVTTQRLILNKKDHLIDLTTQDPTVTTAFTDPSSVPADPTVISDLQRRVTRVLKDTGAYRTKCSDVLQVSYGCGIRPELWTFPGRVSLSWQIHSNTPIFLSLWIPSSTVDQGSSGISTPLSTGHPSVCFRQSTKQSPF